MHKTRRAGGRMRHCFGERLRILRMECEYRQRDLEDALSLRPGACSQYERGLREPGFDLLMTIADFFGVSTDYLLGRAADRGMTGPMPERPKLTARLSAEARRREVAAAHSTAAPARLAVRTFPPGMV